MATCTQRYLLSPSLIHSLMHFAYFTSSFEYVFVFTSYFIHFLHFQRNRNHFKNDDNKVHWWWWGDWVTRRWLWLWHSLLTVDGHYVHLKQIEFSLLIPLISQCCFSLLTLDLFGNNLKKNMIEIIQAMPMINTWDKIIIFFFIAKGLVYPSNNHDRIKCSLKKNDTQNNQSFGSKLMNGTNCKKIMFVSHIIQNKTRYST